MAPAMDTAASRWLTQLAEMRAAIAEVKLSQSQQPELRQYGPDDLAAADDDLSPLHDEHELWDLSSDSRSDDYSSGEFDEVTSSLRNGSATAIYDSDWFRQTITEAVQHLPAFDPLHAQSQINTLLASDKSGSSSLRCRDQD